MRVPQVLIVVSALMSLASVLAVAAPDRILEERVAPVEAGSGLKLDPTVTVGNLLTVAAMILAGLAAYLRLMQRMGKIDQLEGEVHEIKEKVEGIPVLSSRVDALWQDWLRHGRARGDPYRT